jgi:outer membrane receptor protein involved in Fe transport
LSNYYKVFPWLTFDLDLSFTHARYKDAGAADRVAESIGTVVTGGVTVSAEHGWHGSARLRYFGNQPLIEDNSVVAPASATVNLLLGYDWPRWQVSVELLNALNRKNYDIGYFYTSRLQGEPVAGVDDVHFHPAEPRMIRINVSRKF